MRWGSWSARSTPVSVSMRASFPRILANRPRGFSPMTNATLAPSGDQAGCSWKPSDDESWVATPPFESTVQMLPKSENASRLPSGDHDGSLAPQAGESESAEAVRDAERDPTATQTNNSKIETVATLARSMVSGFYRMPIRYSPGDWHSQEPGPGVTAESRRQPGGAGRPTATTIAVFVSRTHGSVRGSGSRTGPACYRRVEGVHPPPTRCRTSSNLLRRPVGPRRGGHRRISAPVGPVR